MNAQALMETARALVAGDKGLLAMDESNPTCDRRFRQGGDSPDRRGAARLSGIDLDHGAVWEIASMARSCTTRRSASTRKTEHPLSKSSSTPASFPALKSTSGAQDLAGHPGEKITEGLDGLRDRLKDYFQMGARFAKWRAVITMADGLPSWGCIEANAHALARYAVLCQEVGLVPIVEPEVLMDGDQSLERRRVATERVLQRVFAQLHAQGAMLEGMILKPNMALSGLACATQASVDEVAEATMNCLLRVVPAAVPGIAFLSGGQSGELASARLSAMNFKFKASGSRPPWALAFSFARAIQQPALEIWAGKEANREAAQQALLHRARCNVAARRGEYSAATEAAAA